MPEVVIFIAFTTSLCAPCRHLKADFAGEGLINFLDVEENQELAESYEITAFPTIIAIVDGKEVARVVGYNRKKQDVLDWMARVRAEQAP